MDDLEFARPMEEAAPPPQEEARTAMEEGPPTLIQAQPESRSAAKPKRRSAIKQFLTVGAVSLGVVAVVGLGGIGSGEEGRTALPQPDFTAEQYELLNDTVEAFQEMDAEHLVELWNTPLAASFWEGPWTEYYESLVEGGYIEQLSDMESVLIMYSEGQFFESRNYNIRGAGLFMPDPRETKGMYFTFSEVPSFTGSWYGAAFEDDAIISVGSMSLYDYTKTDIEQYYWVEICRGRFGDYDLYGYAFSGMNQGIYYTKNVSDRITVAEGTFTGITAPYRFDSSEELMCHKGVLVDGTYTKRYLNGETYEYQVRDGFVEGGVFVPDESGNYPGYVMLPDSTDKFIWNGWGEPGQYCIWSGSSYSSSP